MSTSLHFSDLYARRPNHFGAIGSGSQICTIVDRHHPAACMPMSASGSWGCRPLTQFFPDTHKELMQLPPGQYLFQRLGQGDL